MKAEEKEGKGKEGTEKKTKDGRDAKTHSKYILVTALEREYTLLRSGFQSIKI